MNEMLDHIENFIADDGCKRNLADDFEEQSKKKSAAPKTQVLS